MIIKLLSILAESLPEQTRSSPTDRDRAADFLGSVRSTAIHRLTLCDAGMSGVLKLLYCVEENIVGVGRALGPD